MDAQRKFSLLKTQGIRLSHNRVLQPALNDIGLSILGVGMCSSFTALQLLRYVLSDHNPLGLEYRVGRAELASGFSDNVLLRRNSRAFHSAERFLSL